MTLIDRLRGAVGSTDAARTADRGPGGLEGATGVLAPVHRLPPMDLDVPDQVETATFALG